VLLDEWPHVPAVWDAVRRAVDDDPSSNPFLLAGSAAPAEAPTHSGAGRIVSVRMRPLSLSERGLETPTVSLAAYDAATATTTSLDKIRNAAAAGDVEVPAKVTVGAYREVLERLWILDAVPGWTPSRNQLARLTLAPKHHVADPAPAARLLGLDEGALLAGAASAPSGAPSFMPRDGTLLGQLFESLVTLSVRVYAQGAEARVGHLRTREGRQEVDLVVERGDRRVLGLEVKLSATVTDDDVRHLLWLRERLGPDVLDLVVVTTGTHACRRPDGVAVVPAAPLGA
jgi:predicted AAA+ superfamily ATPase